MSVLRKYITRFGAMRLMGLFQYTSEAPLFHGTRVIVRTSRGQEAGTILRLADAESMASLPYRYEEGAVLRLMTPDDEKECRRIRLAEKDEFRRAKEVIDRTDLVMDLVRVEHIYGGERLIVYYVADGRIDFRELVRMLAAEFQTRIEMRQIGARDETRLLADVGDCGREVCCNTYLTSMLPVTMKMAKLQKATLDPTKISGRCGRLKCCLRYEYEVYTERLAMLPPVGSTINTPDGPGQVIGQELLAKRLQVELEDRSRKFFTLEEIQSASAGQPLPKGDPDAVTDDLPDEMLGGFESPERPRPKEPREKTPASETPRRHDRRRPPKERPPRGERSGEHAGGRFGDRRQGAPPSGPRKGGPRPFDKNSPSRPGFPKKPFRPDSPRPDSPRRPRPENRPPGFHHKRKESE